MDKKELIGRLGFEGICTPMKCDDYKIPSDDLGSYDCYKCIDENVIPIFIDFIDSVELSNLPHGHEEFIGYAAGKHDMRKTIIEKLKEA